MLPDNEEENVFVEQSQKRREHPKRLKERKKERIAARIYRLYQGIEMM